MSVRSCRLLEGPTPLYRLDRLTALLGGPEVWIKRDDLTPVGFGGNKLRKLEHHFALALAEGADTVVTSGAYQSNHCRLTAFSAARMGLTCELLLDRSFPADDWSFENSGNILLDRIAGARLTLYDGPDQRLVHQAEVAARLAREGRRPYVIPPGASDAIGAMGYVDAASELVAQSQDLGIHPTHVLCAVASGGMLAGLAAGFADQPVQPSLIGVSVYYPKEGAHRIVHEILQQLAETHPCASGAKFDIDDRFLAPGYGHSTARSLAALQLFARTEGIVLDPVYTAKVAACLLHEVESGRLGPSDCVIFLHSGGLPGVFGYAAQYADRFAPHLDQPG